MVFERDFQRVPDFRIDHQFALYENWINRGILLLDHVLASQPAGHNAGRFAVKSEQRCPSRCAERQGMRFGSGCNPGRR